MKLSKQISQLKYQWIYLKTCEFVIMMDASMWQLRWYLGDYQVHLSSFILTWRMTSSLSWQIDMLKFNMSQESLFFMQHIVKQRSRNFMTSQKINLVSIHLVSFEIYLFSFLNEVRIWLCSVWLISEYKIQSYWESEFTRH